MGGGSEGQNHDTTCVTVETHTHTRRHRLLHVPQSHKKPGEGKNIAKR